ncbi:SDR family oxidoreductase [Afifella sp. IM 167]|uniref:SDR family oxidoreductase n=1 Tax=Afifella sp. IM 167 TaxID=2033586 RepID=UPI001CCA5067|nr:SDR family oxidoreductase [Afifella sp. IM 167]MBZ8133683.1 short-chain dehydrogenase [Afifella sp. IM 167]
MRRTVVITGASAGVGRAVTRRFAREGARLGLIARGRQRLEETAEEVRALGGEAEIFAIDVADAAAVDAAAEEVERRFGSIDIWINSAMVTILAPVEDISAEEFRRVTEVTYLGCVNGTLSALKRMRLRDRGTIVAVGSALAYRSIPLQAPYCGAKHAIVGFLDSLRSELIHQRSRIKISAVHLPAVNTPQFDWARNKLPNRAKPLGPIFQPEVAAEAIHYTALHPRRELWVARSAITAIIGQKFMPGYLDRLLARTAWSGQQSDEAEKERPDNLYDPVAGGYAAHGRFDARATQNAPALWAAEHSEAIGIGAGILAGGALGWALGRLLSR